jgi:nucleotide-binding universal stress UspA family protein
MLQIERILCPIDFSEFSIDAYDYAQSLAWHYKATLFLQHVIQTLGLWYPDYAFPQPYIDICGELRADAERQLQHFAKTHSRRGVQARCAVQDGAITDAILSLAKAEAVNLIVMGTHGLRGVDHLMLGSVTEPVLRKAQCPVLAVRKPPHGFVTQAGTPDLIHLERILCCTDSPDDPGAAWNHAVSLAEEYSAQLTLLHVLENISSSSDIEDETAKVLERLGKQTSPFAYKNVVKPAARIGKPYQQIVELALESKTDLIVMGVRGRNALDLKIFGSTTYRVVQLGSCPVLVVHS